MALERADIRDQRYQEWVHYSEKFLADYGLFADLKIKNGETLIGVNWVDSETGFSQILMIRRITYERKLVGPYLIDLSSLVPGIDIMQFGEIDDWSEKNERNDKAIINLDLIRRLDKKIVASAIAFIETEYRAIRSQGGSNTILKFLDRVSNLEKSDVIDNLRSI